MSPSWYVSISIVQSPSGWRRFAYPSAFTLRLLHRRADEVAPLGPRAVVVLHVLEAQQMLQHKPREARAFADAAVRDDRRVALDPLIAVELLQLVDALECPIVVAVLPPRNAL